MQKSPSGNQQICCCQKYWDENEESIDTLMPCIDGTTCNGFSHIKCCTDLEWKNELEIALMRCNGYVCHMCKSARIKAAINEAHITAKGKGVVGSSSGKKANTSTEVSNDEDNTIALTLLSTSEMEELSKIDTDIPTDFTERQNRRKALSKLYLSSPLMMFHGHTKAANPAPNPSKTYRSIEDFIEGINLKNSKKIIIANEKEKEEYKATHVTLPGKEDDTDDDTVEEKTNKLAKRRKKYLPNNKIKLQDIDDTLDWRQHIQRAKQIQQHTLEDTHATVLQKNYQRCLHKQTSTIKGLGLNTMEALAIALLEPIKHRTLHNTVNVPSFFEEIDAVLQEKLMNDFRIKEESYLKVQEFLNFFEMLEYETLSSGERSRVNRVHGSSSPEFISSSSNAVNHVSDIPPLLFHWIVLIANAMPCIYSRSVDPSFKPIDLDIYVNLGESKSIIDQMDSCHNKLALRTLWEKIMKELKRYKKYSENVIYTANITLALLFKHYTGLDKQDFCISKRHESEILFLYAVDSAAQNIAQCGVEMNSFTIIAKTLEWCISCFNILENISLGDVYLKENPAYVAVKLLHLQEDVISLKDTLGKLQLQDDYSNMGTVSKLFKSMVNYWLKQLHVFELSMPIGVLVARTEQLAASDALKNLSRRQLYTNTIYERPKSSVEIQKKIEKKIEIPKFYAPRNLVVNIKKSDSYAS